MSSTRPNQSSSAGGAGMAKPSAAQAAKEKATRDAAREAAWAKALRIKQLQKQALENLPRSKLYIILHLRGDPPSANDFHWGFYYHRNISGGTKYHVTNLNSGWIADHGATGGVFKSNFLCVVIQVASVPANKEQQLDQVMRRYDGNLNGIPNITCRVWVMEIMALLVQQGFVVCSDLPGLQTECFNFGNHYMSSAARNDQPRPVVVATKCR